MRLEAAFNKANIKSDHLLSIWTGPPDKEVAISKLQLTEEQKKETPRARTRQKGKVIVRKLPGGNYKVLEGAATVLYKKRNGEKKILVQDEHRINHQKCCVDTPRRANRTDKLDAFRRREIQVLFVVDVLNEGVDIKNIEVVLWLKNTGSVVRLLQQLGRGLRLDVGKRDLLVLDFMDCVKKVQKYIAEGFTMGPRKKKKTKKKKDDEIEPEPEDKEIIELLESQGKIIVGDDIKLFSMSLGGEDEPSEEGLPLPTGKEMQIIAMPQPDEAQKTAMFRAHEALEKIKDQIVSLATVPNEDGFTFSAASIATKIGWDIPIVAEVLYAAGISSRPPYTHPEEDNIETGWAIGAQNQIIDGGLSSAEQRRIRSILKAGSKAIGHRATESWPSGVKDRCRIERCASNGKYRGMCELHYLFAWREIREARAFEDDLVVRFLLEPRPFDSLGDLDDSPSDFDDDDEPSPTKKKITKSTKKKGTPKRGAGDRDSWNAAFGLATGSPGVSGRAKKKKVKTAETWEQYAQSYIPSEEEEEEERKATKKKAKKKKKKKKIIKKKTAKKKITKKKTAKKKITKKKAKKKTSRKKKPRRWRWR
jgi:hypothetical protein